MDFVSKHQMRWNKIMFHLFLFIKIRPDSEDFYAKKCLFVSFMLIFSYICTMNN